MEKTNWIGIATLSKKEIGRFFSVYLQTIVAPVMTTFLFYVIFTLAFAGVEGRGSGINGISYIDFLVPGLIMMGMAQNAFANTSSSLVVGKVHGNIIDILMPPLSPAEILTGFVIGGIVRGLVVGCVSICVLVPFIGLTIANPLYLVIFSILGTVMLALLGVLGGIWAEKFDHIAAVSNFIITPLTFLSGTFYSIDRLTPFWQDLAHMNPFFYMIDGFRAGFIGVADMPIVIGVCVLIGVNIILWSVGYLLLNSGYRIKS
jgi:ABC-2 type transport system permease protein